MACKRQEKRKRDSLVLTIRGTLALFLILFMIPLSYATSPVVDKPSGPEKAVTAIENKKAGVEKNEPKTEEKAEYVYSPVGKTDPFESFLSKGNAGRGATTTGGKDSEWPEGEIFEEGPKTELQKIEISNLTLTAVIKGESQNWAMVMDPKGRGHFLKKGTKIGTGRGEVDKIVCLEKQTPFGVESMRKVVIKEPYLNRDRNTEYRYIEMEMPYTTQ